MSAPAFALSTTRLLPTTFLQPPRSTCKRSLHSRSFSSVRPVLPGDAHADTEPKSPVQMSNPSSSLPTAAAASTVSAAALPPLAPFRIGHGFDLHRLEPGLPLILGGVTLKHDRGCAGHSDGDAVYHCVVDAILGALALPDIGQLFPDSDPKYKGCESHVFMSAAHERMTAEGYEIGNLDVTVILERPKMSPHKVAMRENIARLLHTSVDKVNLKAKTHEKVDALGENRAVSVHAVTTLFPISTPTTTAAAAAAAATTAQQEGANVTQSLLSSIDQRIQTISQIKNYPDSSDPAPSTTPASATTCAVQKLYDTVMARKKDADPSSSWTAKLFAKGRKKIAEKVGEEAVEVVIDAVAGDRSAVVKESADLLYHLNVLWADMDIQPDDVFNELASRQGTSGISEKESRSKN